MSQRLRHLTTLEHLPRETIERLLDRAETMREGCAHGTRKLSWFSTLTGRCLFVNQRGARTDERSLQQLARDIVRGQAHIVVEQRESLIDRAWSTIVGTLRQLSGKPAPQPAT